MLKEIVIQLITIEDCPDCRIMRETLRRAIKDSSVHGCCTIHELDSEQKEAIDVALEKNIEDVPGCSIGKYSFSGKDSYTYESLLKAIEETSKNGNQ